MGPWEASNIHVKTYLPAVWVEKSHANLEGTRESFVSTRRHDNSHLFVVCVGHFFEFVVFVSTVWGIGVRFPLKFWVDKIKADNIDFIFSYDMALRVFV